MASKTTETTVRAAVKNILQYGYADAVQIEVIDKDGNYFSRSEGDSKATSKLANPNPWALAQRWCMRRYRKCMKNLQNA